MAFSLSLLPDGANYMQILRLLRNETRSLINRTESCLYVCLKISPYHSRWFTLCRKPNRNKSANEKSSSGNLLVPVAIPNSPQAHSQGVVAVGSSIYAIGGPSHGPPTSTVWVLNCGCHVWRKAPSMLVKRSGSVANVVDGKIYVAGGCKDFDSTNWMEVFDPRTQIWELVVYPLAEKCWSHMDKSVVMGGGRIVYMFFEKGVAYKPREDKWEAIGESVLDEGCLYSSYCLIGNVLFCYGNLDGIRWYNSKRQAWRKLKFLGGLPKFNSYGPAKMADYGGKLALFWTNRFRATGYGYKERMIWCAVIGIEKRCNGGGGGGDDDEEIWGTVEWIDPVHTMPACYDITCALSATV